ncbi:fatty acyl-CoA synthetase [Rhodovastum atsumiense]|uniref:3-methylmercaptopropionyl-CoA ligase n=1 Tax=Rhodovastum atsumiense TaxID=504468 RepID=A0A5M6J0K8_9PROT|nr:fatty acyl-CoA synthetase [Rhodovastum atsumiense]KAA5614136.1 AMP-binding protein [Rhodovastum atsumiense]
MPDSVAAEARRAGRNTIGDAIGRACATHREKVALRFADRVWTYQALDAETDRIAARLRAGGLARGDRVVAFGRNSDHYLLTWIGCCKAGLIHVPANYALTPSELAYIVRQCGARLVLHGPDLQVGSEVHQLAEVRPITSVMAGDAPPLPEDDGPDDTDVVQILYTSGTTGAPKGAMLTHRALFSEYMSCIVACEFTGQDRSLAALPLYHSAQMHVFCMPQLLCGAEIMLVEAPAATLCLDLIERHRLNSFFAPPTVWITLLRHPDFATRDLTSLRRAYYGAAIMPVPVLQELRARLPGLLPFNCYGQSEIAPLATVLKPHEHEARPASVGRPVLNMRTRVVDLDMNDVPPGEKGEIVHRTPHVMLGYWDKPEETAQAFAGGWFHSGDVGIMDAEGYLTIVDRIKDVINSGGVLVASREVEEALFTHPAVSEVAVIAVPDPKWIEAIAAVVVLRPGHSVTEADLIDHARGLIAPFKLPKRVIFAEDLPRNTAGKLLKRELRARFSGTGTAVMGVAG